MKCCSTQLLCMCKFSVFMFVTVNLSFCSQSTPNEIYCERLVSYFTLNLSLTGSRTITFCSQKCVKCCVTEIDQLRLTLNDICYTVKFSILPLFCHSWHFLRFLGLVLLEVFMFVPAIHRGHSCFFCWLMFCRQIDSV